MKMFLEENDFIAKQGSFCFSGINVFCHQDLTLSCVKIQTQFSFISLYNCSPFVVLWCGSVQDPEQISLRQLLKTLQDFWWNLGVVNTKSNLFGKIWLHIRICWIHSWMFKYDSWLSFLCLVRNPKFRQNLVIEGRAHSSL